MKSILAIFILLISCTSTIAQKDTIVQFFDRSWKVTDPDFAYYFAVSVKNGNYWERSEFFYRSRKVYMTGYYEDSNFKIKVGPFNYYHENGKLKSNGRYLKDKKVGLWRDWHDNGKIQDSGYYNENGIPYGTLIGWNYFGIISDSMILDDQGNGTKTAFYENGAIRYKGPIIKGKQQGAWTYYRFNGSKSQEVNFDNDSAMNFTCYAEDGILQKKDCYYEKESEFPGGEQAWRNYLMKAMDRYLPKDYFEGKFHGIVDVQFIVDKDGKVTEASVRNSTEARLNDAALKIIRNSPKWSPGVQFNQKVKTYKVQPLVFTEAR